MNDLLSKTPEELRKMNKNEVHEGYKKIIHKMLFDFYIDSSSYELETIQDLNDFITKWISEHIKSPHQDWNPGDSGI